MNAKLKLILRGVTQPEKSGFTSKSEAMGYESEAKTTIINPNPLCKILHFGFPTRDWPPPRLHPTKWGFLDLSLYY
jgi:hypothetical protein